jgi:hypothetical protein
MNEMRKLMETVGLSENRGEQEELVMQLEEIYVELEDCISNLAHTIRQLPNESDRERGRRMVLAHFQTALNSDHGWLGGNMTTLKDFIEGLQHDDHEYEEMDESLSSDAVIVDGKAVDMQSIEFDGVDFKDYPDFADAYVCSATFTDGTELTDDQLERLQDDYRDEMYERLMKHIF